LEDEARLLMLPYLAAALLIGMTSSERMGEQPPAFVVGADAWLGEHVRVEANWDASHKIETGDGWSARGAADWLRLRHLSDGRGRPVTDRQKTLAAILATIPALLLACSQWIKADATKREKAAAYESYGEYVTDQLHRDEALLRALEDC